jgi:hypothetical protein
MKNQKLTWYEVRERNLLNKTNRELKKQFQETGRLFKENDRMFLEDRKKMKEDHDDFMKRMDRLDMLFAQTREQIGGISRSNGEFCEEYFINSFKENPTLLGEKFDRVIEYIRPFPKAVIEDEYDLVLQNCTTTALIEMKYKASTNDVGKMFHKLETFRANFPISNNFKIYLCLASFRFPKAVREKAEKEGIVLIQQRGEKIEVLSENIRAW